MKASKALVGGIIGFFVLGPVGLVIGALIGNYYDKKVKDVEGQISLIRSQIEEALRTDEQSNMTLGKLKAALGASLSDKEAKNIVGFMRGYVAAVPVLLEQMTSISAEIGVKQQVSNLLAPVTQYFASRQDLIPDNQGLIGLLDDAYFTQTILERSLRESGQAGDPLTYLQSANSTARVLLGENISQVLDAQVDRIFTQQGIMQQLSQLASQGYFNNYASTYSSTAPYHGINFKKEIVRDQIRHELAKDGIYM